MVGFDVGFGQLHWQLPHLMFLICHTPMSQNAMGAIWIGGDTIPCPKFHNGLVEGARLKGIDELLCQFLELFGPFRTVDRAIDPEATSQHPIHITVYHRSGSFKANRSNGTGGIITNPF